MLNDTLQAQGVDRLEQDSTDMEAHPVLGSFYQLGIRMTGPNKEGVYVTELFDFGVELMWRIAVFRFGEKKAAQEYPFNLLI
jgi:hypothetical protein